MATSWIHAVATSKHFKAGKPEDFIDIHEWIDQFKQSNADIRHRAFLHNSTGPWMAQDVFGHVRTVEKWPLGSGITMDLSVREIVESHIIEDLGWVPSPADWVSCMSCAAWMGGKIQKFVGREEFLDKETKVMNPTRGKIVETGKSEIFSREEGTPKERADKLNGKKTRKNDNGN